MSLVADDKYGRRLKRIAGNRRSPFKEMEDRLYRKILEDRKQKRKVSQTRIKDQTKRILIQLDEDNVTDQSKNFRSSNGWF